MSQITQPTLLYDASGKVVSSSFAPITNRPGSPLTNPQGGLLSLGSDYASTPNAQLAKVDNTGMQYALPMGAQGVPMPVAVNATGSATGNYGTISLGWDNTTGAWRPYSLDPTGAAVIRNALANTCTFAPTAQVNTGSSAGKSMLSIYNATTNLYFRCSALFLMCPPQAAVTGGLLQTSTSYTTIGMQVARFTTAHTAGTVIPPAYHDSRTPTDANITARTGATIAGQQTAALRVMDAAYSSTYPYLTRSDPGMQLPTFGPGEGVTVQVLSALGGSGVNFYVTAIIAQNTA